MIWKGVYDGASNIPSYTVLLDTNEWVDSQVKKLHSFVEKPSLALVDNQLLAKQIGIIFPDGKKEKQPYRIVDYGGSLAFAYVGMQCPKNVKYFVVETDAICKKGTELLIPELVDVTFLSASTKIDFEYDILYMRTALQYAMDWKKELSGLLQMRPNTVLMSHTSCGDIPTYMTMQHWYGIWVPYWFINQAELVAYMAQFGYKLISERSSELIGHLFYDWTNGECGVPETHVLSTTMDLIFEK